MSPRLIWAYVVKNDKIIVIKKLEKGNQILMIHIYIYRYIRIRITNYRISL